MLHYVQQSSGMIVYDTSLSDHEEDMINEGSGTDDRDWMNNTQCDDIERMEQNSRLKWIIAHALM